MGDMQSIDKTQIGNGLVDPGALSFGDAANRAPLGEELEGSERYASDDEVENSRFNPLTLKQDKMRKHQDEMKMHQHQLMKKTQAINSEMNTFISNTQSKMGSIGGGLVPEPTGAEINQNITTMQSASNDRLIQSISMIKDILLSNMQLREELLQISEKFDAATQDNYQLKIENEDLRDRLYLITNEQGFQIDYQAYLPMLDFEQIINDCSSIGGIEQAKCLILTYIFSLKKENRNLHKRIDSKLDIKTRREFEFQQTQTDNFGEFRDMSKKVHQQQLQDNQKTEELDQLAPIAQGRQGNHLVPITQMM